MPEPVPIPDRANRHRKAARAAGSQPVSPIEPLLAEMLRRRASDLHLSSGQQPRLRVDGDLVPLEGCGVTPEVALERALLALAPAPNRDEFAASNDTDFGFEIDGKARFRANYFRDRHGIGAVFRHIPVEILGFDQLGLPEVLREVAALPHGLVLVTGATGSGKSTTLAALVDLINRTRADHIITIEDPVEFVHPSRRCLVHQREIGAHTESFASALRAALREDPD
ncbi:MAG TPA: ATPase, T2SS/T4P/T4SS family, partial [Thermoanaerobaculia bacterium]|nr:ATPase, T2SS/T4P/T4SS family [Thermoanaerobaculia bacterium]